MKRLLIVLLLVLGSSAAASANDSVRGYCEEPNRTVVTSGLNSTTRVQASHPSCTVTVYVHGGGLATIFADNNGTPLANPFTAQSNGQFQAYAANGRYDVTLSSAGYSQTITYSDILLCDPFATGSTCNNGGSTTAHNLLSTTHLDTIPASPPIQGDLITAQNQTSPTGVTPAWARLPLGTAGQVLLSNGLDALWGNLVAGTNVTIVNSGSPSGSTVTINSTGGGTGCTLPGINNVVLEEHPVATCTGSLQYTWDAANANFQIRSATQTNSVGTNNTYTIGGDNITTGTFVYTLGDTNETDFNNPISFGSATQAYLIGHVNSVQNIGSLVGHGSQLVTVNIGSNQIGDNTHANSGGNNDFIFGLNNVMFNAAVVTSVGSNAIGKPGATGRETDGAVFGGNFSGNCINSGTCDGSTGNGIISEFDVIGELNEMNRSGSGTISSVVVGGLSNRVDTVVGNCCSGSTIWGFDNEIDGAVGADAQIYGASNTAHGVQVATCLGASDSYIGGSLNVATTSSNFHVYGGGNTVTSLNCVAMYGMNMTASVANTAYFGMSPVPGLSITASNGLGTGSDNVRRIPLIFSKLPACAAGTEGSFAAITDSTTATPGATITGSSTHHVLGYCQGTNWVVVVGI